MKFILFPCFIFRPMSKMIFILSLIFILAGCNNDEHLSGQATIPPLDTSAQLIKLSDNKDEIAGELTVTSSSDKVIVQWNTDSICNLNTEQTVINMKNGKGTLPVKWLEKQSNGSHGPKGIAYKAGVLLRAGEHSQYVPLIWAEEIDTMEVMKNIQTRASIDELPRVAQIAMIPTTVNMNYENGGTMYVSLTDVPYVVFDLSGFTSDMHINMSLIPDMITSSQPISFKWNAAGVPSYSFSADLVAMSEGIIQTGKVIYTVDNSLTVTPLAHILLSEGGSNIASSVINSGSAWTATVNANASSWLALSSMSGRPGSTTLNFSLAANPGAARSGTVTVMNNGKSQQITITQLACQAGIVINGVTWAPGNLKLQENTYYFSTQYEIGDYFGWNWYSTAINTFNPTDVYNYSYDPCSKVAPAGTWKTPSRSDYQSLIDVGYKVLTSPMKGYLFGGRVLFVAGGFKKDDGILHYGSVSGQYWTSELVQNGLGYCFIYGEQSNTPDISNGHWAGYGVNVRCVKR